MARKRIRGLQRHITETGRDSWAQVVPMILGDGPAALSPEPSDVSVGARLRSRPCPRRASCAGGSIMQDTLCMPLAAMCLGRELFSRETEGFLKLETLEMGHSRHREEVLT